MTTNQLLTAVLSVVFASITSTIEAQTAPLRYWVEFTSKTDPPAGFEATPFNTSEPLAFLSQRAIDRRFAQDIGINEDDLPVAPSYLEALENVDGVVNILVTSKWLNAATIQVADSSFNPEVLEDLAFVNSVRSVGVWPIPREPESLSPTRQLDTASYGAGWLPLAQLGGDWLHEQGHLGAGKWIAVIDAGFEFADVLPVFGPAHEANRIHEGLDALQNPSVYGHHRHGTYVLGTMAALLEDSLIGTAPEADYWLYRSENAFSEYLIEEDFWIYAAEHADSVGVDLINTSLGYSLFDDPEMNHNQSDLNGLTTHISRGMTMAADRGILCVTSAGNSGASSWHNITAPADAHGILAVGAVNAWGQHAAFSGFGPSADGRVKPDVMALGVAAGFPFIDSTIHYGNGTSFASPILCGLAACLWEAHPEATSSEIREAIIQSASLYTQPNDSMGHGLPDFQLADAWLHVNASLPDDVAIALPKSQVFPQPAMQQFEVCGSWVDNELQWSIYQLNGQLFDHGFTAVLPTHVAGRGRITITPMQPPESGLHLLLLQGKNHPENIETLPVIFIGR